MSLLRMKQLSKAQLASLFATAQDMENGHFDKTAAQGKILIPLFFESSTRTRLSFETAMLRLGGQVLPVPETSGLAVAKGESFRDTITVISSFGDILVIRHPEESAIYRADDYSSVPVINGGNGCDEHPTQTLLDLYTIQKEKGQIDGLTVGLIGDLKHARVMHSLLRGLALYDVRLMLISPPELRMPADVLSLPGDRNVTWHETENVQEVLPELDVMYLVMLQHHRITDSQIVERLKRQYYRITPDVLKGAKPDVIVLHPLVRRDEVAVEVDDLPNAAYFRQAENGVFVRMALLSHLLTGTLKLS